MIIGANKGGTTSLFNYLTEHPEVFKPTIKEPMFFNHYTKQAKDGDFRTQKVIKSLKSYLALFSGSENFKVAGESSTSYLANPFCAANIYDFNPDMKLIAILRNPIERAYSNYLMYVRWGEESRSFTQALNDELEGKELPQGKQYIGLGYYMESLKRYKKIFGGKQLKIILNEDLKQNPEEVYSSICNYLNIDSSFLPDFNKKYNTNVNVETRFFQKTIKRMNSKVNFLSFLPKRFEKLIISDPKMSKKNKILLLSKYKDEINQLSVFLNRDLSHWLK